MLPDGKPWTVNSLSFLGRIYLFLTPESHFGHGCLTTLTSLHSIFPYKLSALLRGRQERRVFWKITTNKGSVRETDAPQEHGRWSALASQERESSKQLCVPLQHYMAQPWKFYPKESSFNKPPLLCLPEGAVLEAVTSKSGNLLVSTSKDVWPVFSQEMGAFLTPRNSPLIRDGALFSGSNLFPFTVNPWGTRQAASRLPLKNLATEFLPRPNPSKATRYCWKCPLSTLLSNRDFLSLKSGFVWEFSFLGQVLVWSL